MKEYSNAKPQRITQSDEIAGRILKQKIKIINTNQFQCIETATKTIMDLVIRCALENRLSGKIIALINHVRLHEKVALPCKLVGLIGN